MAAEDATLQSLLKGMKLVLKNVSGESVSLFIEPEETFRDLRKRVNEELGISLYLHDLTIQGKVIDEAQRVSDYFKNTEIQDDLLSELQQDVKCAVPTCENTKFSCPDKAFFFFPTEEMRSHQWALYCHRLHDSSGKVRLELNNQSVICADHFRKDQFVKNSTTLLKRLAVPCVNPEVVIISESSGRRRPTFRSGVAALPKPELTVPLPLTSLESALSLLQHTSDSIGETSAFCRLCSNSCLNCVLIFDDSGKKMNIAEKINSCLPITVKETDPLPKQVCRPCLEKLSIVYEMADTCVKAETKLQAMMADKQFSSHALPSTDLLNPVPPTCLDETVDEAGLGNMTSPKSLFGCPLCTCGKMVTKSGIYRVNKDSIDSENSQDLEKHSNSDDAKVTEFPDHKIKPIITNQNVVEGTCKNNIEPNKTNNISEHLLNGQDCSLKIPDFEVDALYNDTHCIVGMELDSIPVDEDWEGLGMKKETKVIVKDEKEVLVCRLCGIEFSEITALLDHSEDHSDTSCFPCTVCEHWFENKTLLDSHFLEKHCGLSESGPYHCEACGLSFKSVLKLETHFCGSIGGSNKCTDCNKSFRSEARLEFHMRFHNGAQPGYCEICKKTFPDELKLYKHTMYLHGQNKGHCCEECGKVFKSNSSLRYHQRTHQGEKVMKPFTCEYCGKCFIRKSMLRSHFLNIHKDKTQEGSCFTCKICFEAFPSTDQAVSHMDMMHMAECTGVTTYSFEMHTVKRLYLCEYCERCFTDSVNLNSHREQHPSAHPYQCKFCIESFSSSELLGEHKRLHITAGVQDYVSDFTVPTVYMCEFCDRCFMSCIKLSEHLTVHYGEEPYHCRFCSKKFKTHTEVAEHRLSHDKSDSLVDDSYRPYECHYCPKTFGIEDALVKHIRMHTGEKPFICDQCGKGFSQSSGLYTHQKVHSNERPYRCGVCSRTFKIKGDRDVHVRKHSGDRPYKCDFCGKAFMTQHVYSQHRKIHTGERPYKCDVCGIAFRRSHVLTVHKRIHTGEKPNVCDVCGRRYRQKGDMLKHRRLQHGIVKVRIQKIEF